MLPIATAGKSGGRQGNNMLSLNQIKITPRDEQVLQLLMQGCSNKEIAAPTEHQPEDGETTSADPVSAGRHPRRQKTGQAGDRHVRKGADEIMQPRERLTPKETQVAALEWEGQTNLEIAKAIGTTEQVVKNYLRNTFDKLGVWSRLELAIYVARHGGERWREELAMRAVDVLSGTIAS
jgi:DNA-binding NarL/FixJ family response regulator